MPKLFVITLLSFFSVVSMLAQARDALCPAPNSPITVDSNQSVSFEALHLAMQQAQQSAQNRDWVTQQGINACNGYYQEPSNPNPEKSLKPEQARTFLSADVIQQDNLGRLLLSGDVEISQGNRRISCDNAVIEKNQGKSTFSGNLQIRESGVLLLAEQAFFDNQQKHAEITGVSYLLHDAQIRGRSDNVNTDNSQDNILVKLYNSSLTVCPEHAEHWSFQARSIELDKNKGWGTLRSAVFKIEKVPVAYIPYLNFPIDDRRKTGILWPAINGGRHYVDIALPIYFNLAPNYDMTYTPRVLTNHGLLHNLEGRYKQRYSDWLTTGSYIDPDRRINDEKVSNNTELKAKRWLFGFTQKGQFSPYWSSYINYTAVSDIHYFRDWGTTGLDVQKSLNLKREAGVAFNSLRWSVSANIIDYDNLELDAITQRRVEEDYKIWPSLDVLYKNTFQHLTVEPLLQAQYRYFEHDTRLHGSRFYAAPGITLPLRWAAFEMIPIAKIKSVSYLLRSDNDNRNARDINGFKTGDHGVYVPTFSLDSKLFFEYNRGETSSLLTPRLFYYYAHYQQQQRLPNFDTDLLEFSYQQLWREGRMSGFDRIDDANQLTLGLENSWATRGRTFVDVGIGQIFYFQDRKVSPFISDRQLIIPTGSETRAELKRINELNQQTEKTYYRNASDIALQSQWYPSDFHSLRAQLLYDPYQNRVSETGIAYHYGDDKNNIANIGYRYRFKPSIIDTLGSTYQRVVQQLDGSFYLPVSNQWDIYHSVQYDITHSALIEAIAGVKYGGCCWNVMLAFKRERKTFTNNARVNETADTNYRNYWFIQFELKGLGGVTDVISRLLNERIEGFKQREY